MALLFFSNGYGSSWGSTDIKIQDSVLMVEKVTGNLLK